MEGNHVVNDVFFTDCRVPVSAVVGEPEQRVVSS